VQQDLETLVAYLRAGDLRLVRPTPIGETAKRQAELGEAGGVEVAVAALGSLNAKTRALGAEIVHLMTTNNPANRAAFGSAGIIPDLIRMVEAGSEKVASDDVIIGSEEAAESLWILAFNGGENHRQFAEHGAAPALAKLVQASPSAKGKMWAGAALGNLVAAYGNVPAESTEAMRLLLVEWPNLISTLVSQIALGPVRQDAKWPSQALKTDRHFESIIPWGAGQALKNLALSMAAHQPIREAKGIEALCQLAQSPDWLEKMKAGMTLDNLKARCDHLQEL